MIGSIAALGAGLAVLGDVWYCSFFIRS